MKCNKFLISTLTVVVLSSSHLIAMNQASSTSSSSSNSSTGNGSGKDAKGSQQTDTALSHVMNFLHCRKPIRQHQHDAKTPTIVSLNPSDVVIIPIEELELDPIPYIPSTKRAGMSKDSDVVSNATAPDAMATPSDHLAQPPLTLGQLQQMHVPNQDVKVARPNNTGIMYCCKNCIKKNPRCSTCLGTGCGACCACLPCAVGIAWYCIDQIVIHALHEGVIPQERICFAITCAGCGAAACCYLAHKLTKAIVEKIKKEQ